MPDGITIKISGIKEVNKSLYRYSQQLGDKVVLASLKEGAKVVQKEAKRRAPKKTGRLKRGIVVRNSKIYKKGRFSDKLGVYLTLRTGKKGVFYGRFIEDGWKPRGNSKRVKGINFIKGAFNSRKYRAVEMIRRALLNGESIIRRKIRNIR